MTANTCCSLPPHDGVALEKAVERLLTESGLRDRLAAAARTRALASFDQHRVANASLSTYAAVLAGSRGIGRHRRGDSDLR